jgi:hypothetical protein
MNNLLFTALIIALLYYFFYYLPNKKQLTNPPLTQSQFTQTEPTQTIKNDEPGMIKFPSAESISESEVKLAQEKATLEKDIVQKEQTIIGLNNSYNKLEQKTTQQIKELQSQVRELVKRPSKPTNSKGTQTDELTTTLDALIKDIQELNNEL